MPDANPDDAFRAFEAAGWDRVPGAYDDLFGPITARAVEPLLDLAGVRAGTRVLDLASGPGYLAARAAARGADATGIDLSPAMVELARRRHPNLAIRTGAAEALPFDDDAFGAVVCGFGLGHFANPPQVIAEAARVVAPGGRVALSWWGPPAECRLLGVFADAIERAGAAPPPDLPPGPPFFRYSTEAPLDALFRGAGLGEIERRRLAFFARFSDAEALWSGVMSSSVRTAATIAGQPEPTQRAIRAAFDDLASPYGLDGALAIPVVIMLTAASKKVSEGFPR